ncbi:RNA-binding transcriptional accessory protein [Anoxybacillus kestanbolensis]|uniref:Tex family protein n=1 Tax=Anoxybacillus TaxID=150247 RepID=UPI001EDB4954|nr:MULTISPECIES: Tex family protein [Anoxybacillus]MCG3083045.1 RNA-binding transcriptional accessory protein [Anoxybacillus sp. LAT27]MCG5026479.1 RNA-binding transcriptional accessory protein [Anoxybacillus flavithermus]MCL9971400.1 RNA-binding transcriptional accessory protein [Anoxybacillus kestanbolensis]
MELLKQLAAQLNIPFIHVQHVIQLHEEGNTIPFIARYRKEMTGALDEVQIRTILDEWNYLQNLAKRKEEVIRLIDEQGKLTDELKEAITKATKLQEVEDLYRPYKQKRRTKATIAKEKGLEPFAEWLLTFPSESIAERAKLFIDEQKEVRTIDEVIQGAKDIIAEKVSDDAALRQWIRQQTWQTGTIVSFGKETEKDEKRVFEMYYDHREPIAKAPAHRILAMNRGEKEGILRIDIDVDADRMTAYIRKQIVTNEQSSAAPIVVEAIEDAYKRLIAPSIERDVRNELTEQAEERAIHIFAENLRNLLLQPPLKGRVVLGVDPAYRTGCKLAVVDETGKVLHIDVIYPHPPKNEVEKAKEKLMQLLHTYQVELIAIGNGTASRETEQFVADTISEWEGNVFYLIVNEAGASVYSASDLARKEFPHLQVEERSAVSIARRVQDPLAELVKIDPKSVGVGQYQHDVSQKKLEQSLQFVVETVVNQVGVNVNTASPTLLQYVSGLTKTVAENIVKYREEHGKFTNRMQLKHIPRLGAKTYEQCIGFLRIIDGDEPLDRTPIHPERYEEVYQLLRRLGFSTEAIGSEQLRVALEGINIEEAAQELNIGVLTLQDIIDALKRPERDPRDDLPKPILKQHVLKMEDLKKGMELEGTVRNVVDFGVFVDIGVKQDGLVHISKLSNRYVKHPLDVVSVGDIVKVWVDSVDLQKERIALTMVPPTSENTLS